MTAADPPPLPPLPEPQQSLQGFLTNAQWDALLADVNSLVQDMEALPASEHRTQVFALLDGVDAIHREGLRRLVRLFKEGVLEQVATDPAIRVLLELYDLLPDEPDAEEKPPGKYRTIPITAAAAKPARQARFPHWLPVLKQRDELASGKAQEHEVDGQAVLVCRREEQFFALESRCARDGAALTNAILSGYTLTCPQHPGCYYDVRSGARLGSDGKIPCFPVQVDANGRVLVGLDMDFVPNLPSF